jgi:hypothetical protein
MSRRGLRLQVGRGRNCSRFCPIVRCQHLNMKSKRQHRVVVTTCHREVTKDLTGLRRKIREATRSHHAFGSPVPGEGRVSRTSANANTWKYWQSAAKQDAKASRNRTARPDGEYRCIPQKEQDICSCVAARGMWALQESCWQQHECSNPPCQPTRVEN